MISSVIVQDYPNPKPNHNPKPNQNPNLNPNPNPNSSVCVQEALTVEHVCISDFRRYEVEQK